MREEVLQFYAAHNSTAAVNRLPTELLTIIFRLVEAESDKSVALINATHVCRQWRNIALDSPFLWTRIVLKHPVAIETFLQRSRGLPIELEHSTGYRPMSLSPKFISSEIRRMRCLRLSSAGGATLDMILRRLKVPSPKLEELSLERVLGQFSRRFPMMYDPAVVPPDLDGLPMLKSLSLKGIPLLYVPTGPTMLTHLHIGGALSPLPTILNLLERSPQLETLYLRGYYDSSDAGLRQVSLPRLRSFEFSTVMPEPIRELVSRLVLPKYTNLSLAVSLEPGEEFAEILPPHASAERLELECLRGLRRLELMWTELELWLRAYRAVDDFHSPALEIAPAYHDQRLSRGFVSDWPIDATGVEAFVVCGRHRKVDRAGTDHKLTGEQWGTMLGALPALRTLRLITLNEDTLLRLMDVLVAGVAEVVCPRLETVELFDMFLTLRFWHALESWAKARNRVGGRLKRIELFDAEIEGMDLEGSATRLAPVGVQVILNNSQEC
ncbi:hypothetical protein BD413DRAFT_464317 [Trametes elegans]|nr:hypothetical protein BD413DRAFT_464317 [Trametes elegans]